jgi:hypothetical protein
MKVPEGGSVPELLPVLPVFCRCFPLPPTGWGRTISPPYPPRSAA